jgi:hypothetical protein
VHLVVDNGLHSHLGDDNREKQVAENGHDQPGHPPTGFTGFDLFKCFGWRRKDANDALHLRHAWRRRRRLNFQYRS